MEFLWEYQEIKLCFFDTKKYLLTGKFDGFSVNIDNLVK